MAADAVGDINHVNGSDKEEEKELHAGLGKALGKDFLKCKIFFYRKLGTRVIEQKGSSLMFAILVCEVMKKCVYMCKTTVIIDALKV